MNLLRFTHREEWRDWLTSHFQTEKEAWLVYPKKETGKPRILYNDAVEEALCFGWIDSIVRRVDAKNTAQKFTPRNPKSTYSQPNIERLRWLHQNGLIHESVGPSVESIIKQEFVFPSDILDYVKADKAAWDHYQRLGSGYKRIRIAFIDAARKRPHEFEKRLRNFIEKTRENRLIRGYGGIEKYYE